jgi:hypothetical protein
LVAQFLKPGQTWSAICGQQLVFSTISRKRFLSLDREITDMNISTILDHIDSGHMALSEVQRGYVWNRDQVRVLFDSLYKCHPVGGLLELAFRAYVAREILAVPA